MILVIGGAYQGKMTYARQTLGAQEAQIVPKVEETVRAWLDAGLDPEAEIRRAAASWQDSVVLLRDVSCGVVPMDAGDRAWREAVGRCGAYLAGQAQRVIRVFCGIGTVIKDA